MAITPNIIPIMVEHPTNDGPYGAGGAYNGNTIEHGQSPFFIAYKNSCSQML